MNNPDKIKYIVLLHGFLSSSKYWKKITPHLTAAGYTVIPIDLLGFGKAPKPNDATYDYDVHTSYIYGAIKRHKIKGQFVIIGHSMGAMLAARYARLHPAEVRKVILLNPPLYLGSSQAYETLRKTNFAYRLLLDSRYRKLGWKILRLAASQYIKEHSHVSREMSLENIIQKPQIFNDLARMTTKTLVLVGTRDRPVYITNLKYITKNPLVTISIKDVTHHAPISNSILVKRLILSYIST